MRIKKYFAENEAYVAERQAELSAALEVEYTRREKELLQEFTDAFHQVFLQAARMQQQGEKGAIAWVCVSYLRSSLLTKSYDLRIDLYDENFYLDITEAAGYWSGAAVYQHIEADIDYFIKMARKKLIRVTVGEIRFFMNDYVHNYNDYLRCYFQMHLRQLLEMKSYQSLEKTADIQFTFGEYLDKTTVIYPQAARKEAARS